MIYVAKELYDFAKVIGEDVVVGGNLDTHHTVNRLYALYRNNKVVGYTLRQIVTHKS